MLAILKVEFASPLPIYEQIKRRIKQAVVQNIVQAGEELPSIRELAAFLKINPNTVARAFRDLSFEGIVSGRAGKGFWVNEPKNGENDKLQLFREEFLRMMEKATETGISTKEIRAMINDFFGEDT